MHRSAAIPSYTLLLFFGTSIDINNLVLSSDRLSFDHADRDFLGLTQQEFNRAPLHIALEVLVAAGLCLWGEHCLLPSMESFKNHVLS